MLRIQHVAFAALFLMPAAAMAQECTVQDQTSAKTIRPAESCKMELTSLQLRPGHGPDASGTTSAAAPGGAKTLQAPKPSSNGVFRVGDSFPVYQHNMLIDPPRYGLPAVSGNWRYYRVKGVTYKVDAASLQVMEVVETAHLAQLN